ncbi:hypothetical protein ACFE04_020014 [Oxalis oulophora]
MEKKKKAKWFSFVKKAFSPDSKRKKQQQQLQLEESDDQKALTSSSIYIEPVDVPHPHLPTDLEPEPEPEPEEVTLTEVENVQNKITLSTTEVAREVVPFTSASHFAGKSKEEVAAIQIQTAFRGHLAKRTLRALRGLVRLKTLMKGAVVKRQAATTLRCMQTLSHLHSQIRTRRIVMAEENQALQKQLLQKHAKELASLEMGDDWDDSVQSKEQIEASLLCKYEAANRRERAMAYAFTHQQNLKNSLSKSVNPMFMDPRNPTWGWSWLERWMAARPWESRSLGDKELNSDRESANSVFEGEISKSYAEHQLNFYKQSPTTADQKPSRAYSPLSPLAPAKPALKAAVNNRKLKSASPKGIIVRSLDDDSRSVISIQSSKNRRHSSAGSSVRDDESQAGNPDIPSYMVPTQSARAKSRLSGGEENVTSEIEPLVSAKKRLSYPPTPTKPRRHSGPPKVNCSVIAAEKVNSAVCS